ncbi:MAG: PQQ-binding-like beta-propeller repeat protein [Planctomycetes bacterium]|nr:PQQ-binding-like beta-propeller repeat protein [Planctomycetota bacterium]
MRISRYPTLAALSSSFALCCCAQEAPSPRFDAADAVRHAPPRARAADAVNEDWPGFLGPRRDARSRETHIDHTWDSAGPKLVWEAPRGEGFAAPVIVGERVLHYHRVGEVARLEARALESGALQWVYEHPCDYRGEIAADGGPRAAPLAHGGLVFVHGVEGTLHAVELEMGTRVWSRDLAREYRTPDSWFGVAASPIARGEKLFVNVGGADDACVVALEVQSGKELWRAAGEPKWGADCASPVLAPWGGAERLFVLCGGKTRPAVGGLLLIEPENGIVEQRFPFRSRSATSVSGCSPLVVDDTVFLTASYGTGSALLQRGEDGALRERWRASRIGVRFSPPLFLDGAIVLIDGVANQAGAVVGLDPASGEERWRCEPAADAGSLGEGNLLAVDGRVLALGDGGDLFRLRVASDAAAIEARAALFDAPDSWTPLALARGLLLVCQNEPDRRQGTSPRLLCYDLRAPR